MTLKQRLELITKQQEELLSIVRRLERGGGKGKGPGPDLENFDKAPARRWNQRGRYFELFLPGSGWMQDHGPPRPGDQALRNGGGR